MNLSLSYCPELNVYRLRNEDTGRENTITQSQIDAAGEVVRAWAALAKANPDTITTYDTETK